MKVSTCSFAGRLSPRYQRIHVMTRVQTRLAISQAHVGVHPYDLVIRLDTPEESGSGGGRVRYLLVRVVSLRDRRRRQEKKERVSHECVT
jgi:hypothetical protein